MRIPSIQTSFIFVTFCLSSATLNSQAPALPSNVAGYLENGGFGEDDMLLGGNGKRDEFVRYVEQNWPLLLDNLNALAPTLLKKRMILAACEQLSPEDYLLVLEKMADNSQKAGFDTNVWRQVIYPTNYKYGFLDYNFQNPRVTAIINRILATTPPDGPNRSVLEEIRGGQRRLDFIEYNRDNENGDLTRVSLPE